MASANTRFFVVASPTGSTEGEFFSSVGTSNVDNSGSNYINLGAIVGGGPFLEWGTVNNFPTYSAYSPGIYIRDLLNSPYTSSFYTYIDSDDVTPVTSIQQDLQKIFFPGIVTGSGFGGKLAATGSLLDEPVGFNTTGSIGFIGSTNPVTFANTVSMSFAPNSFNRINFVNFLTTEVDSNYQLIYRDFQSNAQAVYNVNSSFILQLGGAYVGKVTPVSSTGSLILNNSSSVTFIDTTGNQATFYVVGVANPAAGLPFAGQSTVGTADGSGDFRSGIIKVYATESNNTADWNKLIQTVSGDAGALYTLPGAVAANHNLIMFTASAGNAGTASWDLFYEPPA